jgi:hypothetical protein
MQLSGRAVSRVAFPFCYSCKWHRVWSGHFGVGMVRLLGPLFAAGGIAGGVLLGLAMTKEGGTQQGWCGVLALVFLLLGYAVAMVLVGLLGRFLAPRRSHCASRGDAVVATVGRARWQFRFTNPQFEDAFRAMNQPIPEGW